MSESYLNGILRVSAFRQIVKKFPVLKGTYCLVCAKKSEPSIRKSSIAKYLAWDYQKWTRLHAWAFQIFGVEKVKWYASSGTCSSTHSHRSGSSSHWEDSALCNSGITGSNFLMSSQLLSIHSVFLEEAQRCIEKYQGCQERERKPLATAGIQQSE